MSKNTSVLECVKLHTASCSLSFRPWENLKYFFCVSFEALIYISLVANFLLLFFPFYFSSFHLLHLTCITFTASWKTFFLPLDQVRNIYSVFFIILSIIILSSWLFHVSFVVVAFHSVFIGIRLLFNLIHSFFHSNDYSLAIATWRLCFFLFLQSGIALCFSFEECDINWV